jgi:hypothetical protein
MQIHECRIGMVVEFGRGNGQWTKAEIIKINPKKAKVKTLEGRGSGRGSFEGAVWCVPYSMMRLEGQTSVESNVVVQDTPYPFNQFDQNNYIMRAIVDCYNRLEPEWLTADGERPMSEVRRLKAMLENKIYHLCKALGVQISESVAFDWDDKRIEFEKSKEVKNAS